MQNIFTRTQLIYGADAMEKLRYSRVAVFGVGGVGGYAVEALARSGIGTLDLIDNDTVSITNINRQIIATHKSIGRYKVDVAAERVLDINPSIIVNTYRTFYSPETENQFDFSLYDYVVDAIDTVTGKIALAVNADTVKTPIISSMGAGNKVDPTAFEVADIYKTSVDPLARVMRNELKKRGIRHLKVVYSKEIPFTVSAAAELPEITEQAAGGEPRKRVPGSTAFVPSAVGLIIASEVVKDITGVKSKGKGV